jgi:hypothetical protein
MKWSGMGEIGEGRRPMVGSEEIWLDWPVAADASIVVGLIGHHPPPPHPRISRLDELSRRPIAGDVTRRAHRQGGRGRFANFRRKML